MKEITSLALLGLAFFLATKADGTPRFRAAKLRARSA